MAPFIKIQLICNTAAILATGGGHFGWDYQGYIFAAEMNWLPLSSHFCFSLE